MSIDPQKYFFKMSFRFDKCTPEAFGLALSESSENIYVDKSDGFLWEQQNLYDFGWGAEYGFVRLPALGFYDLWDLLLNSKIQDNQHGAACLLEEKYADELLEKIESIFSNPGSQINERLKTACRILKLESGINRGNLQGKNYAGIKDKATRWNNISEQVKAFYR